MSGRQRAHAQALPELVARPVCVARARHHRRRHSVDVGSNTFGAPLTTSVTGSVTVHCTGTYFLEVLVQHTTSMGGGVHYDGLGPTVMGTCNTPLAISESSHSFNADDLIWIFPLRMFP